MESRTVRKTSKSFDATLKVGWWVAATLKPGSAPLRVYVGQIQSVDSRGLRMTLVDWISGNADSWDLFIPHKNLESALVATNAHDLRRFGNVAGKWEETMNVTKERVPPGEKVH